MFFYDNGVGSFSTMHNERDFCREYSIRGHMVCMYFQYYKRWQIMASNGTLFCYAYCQTRTETFRNMCSKKRIKYSWDGAINCQFNY